MIDINETAEYLLANHDQQLVIETIPQPMYPVSAEEAYRVQDRVVMALTTKHGSRTCGYKLACTNTPIMELLGVDGPFSGRMMSHSVHASGVALNATDFVRRVIELEFVFVILEQVPLSVARFTADTIKPYLGAFHPGIEIVDHCYQDLTQVGGNALIAHNAIHGASVLGEAEEQWRTIELSRHAVRIIVNDDIFSEGRGENVLGSPLIAVAWLANHLQSREITLKSGDIVTTGTACDVYNAQAGDNVTADFGKLGSVSLSFV